MKKYALFLSLASIVTLSACNNPNQAGNYPANSSYHFNQGQNGQYEASQPQGNDNQNQRDNHEEWKQKRLADMVDHFFAHADTNHDGTISWKEFQTYMHKKFREADTNHNGKLDRGEVTAMLKRHMNKIHEEMREGKESKESMDDNDSDNDTQQ